MDDVYLLNSPFTFQSMEKHAAYCAMLRLGLHVPETVLIPYKNPPENARYAFTAEKYNQPFDLDAIAESIGYPLVHEALRRRRVGGRDHDPRLRRTPPRLRRIRAAADASAEGRLRIRGLRAEPVDRRRDDGHELRPRPAHARPVLGLARLPGRGHRRGDGEHRQARQRLLPLGVQLLRDPDPGRRRLPDRLRQRLPRHRADQPALLLPLGAEGARQVVGLLHRHRTAAAVRPGHPPVLRHRRPGRPGLRREAAGLSRPGRRLLPGGGLHGLLRQPAGPSRRGHARLGARSRLRPAPRRDGAVHVPGARARPLHRALPGPARDVDARRGDPPQQASPRSWKP